MQQENQAITAKALLVDALIVYVKGRANGDPAFRLSTNATGIAAPANSLRLTIQTLIKTNRELIYRDDLHRPLTNIISAEIEKIKSATRERVAPEARLRVENEANKIARKPPPKAEKISEKNTRSFAWALYNILTAETGFLPHEAYYATVLVAGHVWAQVEFKNVADEISREIHFPPEHQQAGISILSYFSVILKQKLPNNDAAVSIRQEKDRVVLTIKYQDGTEENIIQLLAEYGMVVTGKLAPESFLSDPLQATALKQKLELAEMEVRHTRELLAIERSFGEKRFASLETELLFLKQQLANQLQNSNIDSSKLLDVIFKQIGESQSASITEITKKLVESIIKRDETEFKRQLTNFNKEDPTLLEKIQVFFLTNTVGGVVGNSAYDWLKTLWPILPK